MKPIAYIENDYTHKFGVPRQSGLAEDTRDYHLKVDFPEKLKKDLPKEKIESLIETLSLDPRPSYHNDPARIYSLTYAGKDIKFTVDSGVLHVINIIEPM